LRIRHSHPATSSTVILLDATGDGEFAEHAELQQRWVLSERTLAD